MQRALLLGLPRLRLPSLGMARVMGEPIPGINAVCAPVFAHTGTIALGVTAIGPAGNFDTAWSGMIAQKVQACAHQISERLGYASA